MEHWKRLFLFCLAIGVFALFACGEPGSSTEKAPQDAGTKEQGAAGDKPFTNVGSKTCLAAVKCDCGVREDCTFDCALGGCDLTCASPSRCTNNCAGGRCKTTCGANATCTANCSGGSCQTLCGENSNCTVNCVGGSCQTTCGANATCKVNCGGKATCVCTGAGCS